MPKSIIPLSSSNAFIHNTDDMNNETELLVAGQNQIGIGNTNNSKIVKIEKNHNGN